MFFAKKKMIDLNEYTPKELEANVENFILEYHGNRHKNKIFKELCKIDSYLLQMKESGVSINYIRQFIIDNFDYTVGVGTLSEYYKVYHKQISKS